MKKCLAISCIFFVGGCGAEPNAPVLAVPSALTITVHGARGNLGKVILAIYDKPEEFDTSGKSVALIAVPVSTREITLDAFPKGKFAIAAFHDENDNSDLDMNGSLPAEGYGSSGNLGKWDNPSFKRAVFVGRTANVKIHYLD